MLQTGCCKPTQRKETDLDSESPRGGRLRLMIDLIRCFFSKRVTIPQGTVATLLLFLTAITGLAQPASSCSCLEMRKTRQVLPADGASNVPTDATIRVFLRGFVPELRGVLASEYRLVDADGVSVDFASTVVATRLDLKPIEPLSPGSRYTLEQVFAYDLTGFRLTDSERWERVLESPESRIRGRWYPVASFETSLEEETGIEGHEGGSGKQPSGTGPERNVQVQGDFRFGVDGVCTWGPWVRVSFGELVGESETDVLELQVEGQGTLVTTKDLHEQQIFAEASACSQDPVEVGYKPPLRARVSILDLSGREVGGTEWREVVGPSDPIERAERVLQPEEIEAVERWPQLEIENLESMPSLVGTPSPPRSCPFGFEAEPWVETEPSKVVRLAASGLPLASDGRVGWRAFSDRDGAIELLSVASDGWISSVLADYRGYPHVLGVGAHALYLVASEVEEDDYVMRLVALDSSDGTVRWSRSDIGKGVDYNVAAGAGTVLMTWQGYLPDHDSYLTWALFEEGSGEPVFGVDGVEGIENQNGGEAESGKEGVGRNLGLEFDFSGAPAITFVEDHFLFAWVPGDSQTGPMKTILLRPDGTTSAIQETGIRASGEEIDMAVTESGVGIVSIADGQVEWTLLNPDGFVEVAPVRVSAGVGGRDSRRPEIAWNGNFFAVAWSANPGVYVAAVDRLGNVSPALRVDSGVRNPSSAGVAALNGVLVVSWTENRERTRFASLRCRSEPDSGAPQQIAPLP